MSVLALILPTFGKLQFLMTFEDNSTTSFWASRLIRTGALPLSRVCSETRFLVKLVPDLSFV